MPLLKRRRQEIFAQNRAKGMTQIAAYTAAGYTGSDSNASALEAKPHVKARVIEIQREVTDLDAALSTAEGRAEILGFGDLAANEALFREESRRNLYLARTAANIEESNKALEMYGVALGVLKHRSNRQRIPMHHGPKRPSGRQSGTKMIDGILLSPEEVALYESRKKENEARKKERAVAQETPETGSSDDRVDDSGTPEISIIHQLAERLRSNVGELPPEEDSDPPVDERDALPDNGDRES